MGISHIFSDEADCKLNNNAVFSEDGNLEFHDYAWIAAGICVVVACGLSFYLIYKHCRNYTCPNEQKFIIRLLLMVPIYAVDSFLSFRLYKISVYFDLARDCYEAFVINTFFCLLIEYQGGYKKIKESFAQKKTVKLIFPLNRIEVEPKRGLLRTLRRLTLQYVLVEPFLSVLALVLQSLNLYCDGDWNFSRGYLYITAVLFVSVTVAMYALVMFYALTSEDMAKHKPLPKFAAVKAIIFLSFWQSVGIAVLVQVNVIRATAEWSTSNISDGVQNVIICGEMVVAAIAHIWIFTYKDYRAKEGNATPLFRSFAHAFNPVDIYNEVIYSFFPKSRKQNKKTRGDVEVGTIVPKEVKDNAGGKPEEKTEVEKKHLCSPNSAILNISSSL